MLEHCHREAILFAKICYWEGTSGIIECGPCPVGAFFGVGAIGVDGVDGDCVFVGNPTTCTPVTL